MKLKVMTYNIRTLLKEKDKFNSWGFRKQRVLDVIKNYGPDILCVQEDQPEQTKYLRGGLAGYSNYGFFTENKNSGVPGERNTIFFRKSKFKLLQRGHFWLTNTPNKKSRLTGQAPHHRILIFVKLVMGCKPIYLFNTHFEHRSQTVQLKQAEILSSLIKQLNPENYIICGDFNGTKNSEHIKLLEKRFYLVNDKFSHEKVIADWSERHPPRECIDFIFSNLNKINLFVDNTKYVGRDRKERTPSDHSAIIAELEL